MAQLRIDRLIPKARGKARLAPAEDREAIPASKGEAVPETSGQASTEEALGLIPPFTQEPHPGTATVFDLTSTDGITVFQYWSQSLYLDDDDFEVRFDHIASP